MVFEGQGFRSPTVVKPEFERALGSASRQVSFTHESPPGLYREPTSIKVHAHSPPLEREYVATTPKRDSISSHGISDQRIYHSQTPRRSTRQAGSGVDSDPRQHLTSTKFYDNYPPPEREYITIPLQVDSISGHGLPEQRMYNPQVAPGISRQTPRRNISEAGSLVEANHRR